MRKSITRYLLTFILFTNLAHAHKIPEGEEWNGFIPVYAEDDKVYMLLKKHQTFSKESQSAETVLLPILGGYRSFYESKIKFLKEKIGNLIKLSPNVNFKEYYKKALRVGPISRTSVSRGEPDKDIRNTFFQLPTDEFEVRNTTCVRSPVYKIYFIPVTQRDYKNKFGTDAQWISLEEVKNSLKRDTPSHFEEALYEYCKLSPKDKEKLHKKGKLYVLDANDWQAHHVKFPSSPVEV